MEEAEIAPAEESVKAVLGTAVATHREVEAKLRSGEEWAALSERSRLLQQKLQEEGGLLHL